MGFVLRRLPLFEDDLYLGMQVTNLWVVDQILRDMEIQLLARYIEEERTPGAQATLVSAISQLWIFGLYELLRNWRSRAKKVLDFAESLAGISRDQRKERIQEKKREVEGAAEASHGLAFRWPAFERASQDRRYVRRLQVAVDGSELLFRRIEALRVNLAKHEIPKSNAYAMAPGYGRIDMGNGSISWQVLLGDNEVDMVSRRELADECWQLGKDRSRFILPRFLQAKVAMFPKRSYALRQVAVRLKDGTEYRRVLIYWSKLVVGVLGSPNIPFDARNVVEVEPDTDIPDRPGA